jgi:hypothetical protein
MAAVKPLTFVFAHKLIEAQNFGVLAGSLLLNALEMSFGVRNIAVCGRDCPASRVLELRCGEKYKDAEFGATSNDFMPQVRRFVSCDGLQEQSTHENENKMPIYAQCIENADNCSKYCSELWSGSSQLFQELSCCSSQFAFSGIQFPGKTI